MSATQTEQVRLLRIIDGDTVEVQRRGGLLSTGAKERILLYGIDAPESSQKGGEDAIKYLGKIIGGRTNIWLEPVATDQYGRTVGVISKKRGDRAKSYNYEMVRGGHAHCYMVDPADREALNRSFHFHPGPCIQFSGVERSATPSGPDNLPQKRQSDTEPLRSRPPKAGDRSSRHAGTLAGAPGSPETRSRGLICVTETFRPTGTASPAGPSFSSITNRNRSYRSWIR